MQEVSKSYHSGWFGIVRYKPALFIPYRGIVRGIRVVSWGYFAPQEGDIVSPDNPFIVLHMQKATL